MRNEIISVISPMLSVNASWVGEGRRNILADIEFHVDSVQVEYSPEA